MSIEAMKFNLKIIALQATMGLWLLTVAMTLPGEQAHAQTLCTTNNWSGVVGEANLAVGEASATNRKYSGPCGLRVTLNGTETYVQDDNPLNETTFNVRFYFYMDGVTEDVELFRANDATSVIISAYYDATTEMVYVDFNAPGGTETVLGGEVASGWYSLEIYWSATENPSVALQQGLTGTSQTWSNPLDMSGITIESAQLGALGTVPTGGTIDFDDYDSRREGQPGRLLLGDADGNGVVAVGDLFAVNDERLGTTVASGQADCTEDGIVSVSDLFCVHAIRIGEP